MTKFIAVNVSVSADGYMAGPNQSLENPLGENGPLLHKWVFPTQAFQQWHGEADGELGLDNDFAARGFTNIGATIMGRNMFTPSRGAWSEDGWQGWWGPNPGFKHPVFILTHHPRSSVDMGNGTVFHFVTGGIDEACTRAAETAGDKYVRVGGGANTLHQFLEAGLLDELHIAESSIELKAGEKLFSDPEKQLREYQEIDSVNSELVRHRTFVKI
jgi:dihydrofolate reductase